MESYAHEGYSSYFYLRFAKLHQLQKQFYQVHIPIE